MYFLSGDKDELTPPTNADNEAKGHEKSGKSIFKDCVHTPLSTGRFKCDLMKQIFQVSFGGDAGNFSRLETCPSGPGQGQAAPPPATTK